MPFNAQVWLTKKDIVWTWILQHEACLAVIVSVSADWPCCTSFCKFWEYLLNQYFPPSLSLFLAGMSCNPYLISIIVLAVLFIITLFLTVVFYALIISYLRQRSREGKFVTNNEFSSTDQLKSNVVVLSWLAHTLCTLFIFMSPKICIYHLDHSY